MSEPFEPTKRDRAVAHAKQGFRVFKLQVNGKKPAIENFYDVASSDPDVVHAIWTCPVSGEPLDNNIGILTGNGLLVVDVDVKNGKKGDESLNLLELLYLNIDTLTARTPSGGRHLFYRVPPGREIRNTTSKLGAGLDTRGYHGFVVGAGSTIDGRAYEWVDPDKLILDTPEELLVELQAKSKLAIGAKNKAPLCKLDHEDAIARSIDYLRNSAPEATEGAGGDHTTYAVAARLGDFGLSQDTAYEAMLLHWNEEKAHPPWGLQDLAEKVTHAYRYRMSPIGVASAHSDFEEVTLAPADASESEWREPADLWAENAEPPRLPSGVVPELVERFAVDRGRRLGVEPGAVAAALITALGSLVSAENTLQMRQRDPNWKVKPVLWNMLIAPPGANKSATLGEAIKPVRAFERTLRAEYAKEKQKFDLRKATKSKPNASDVFLDPGQVEPRLCRKLVNDATTEKLVEILGQNPWGLLLFTEELMGFIGSMDAYRPRAGKDRPFWLQAKDGGPFTVDRKTSGSVFAPNCAISVLGSIQNDKIYKVGRGLMEDGFLQRFMPVYLKRTGNGEDIPPDTVLDQQMEEIAIEIGSTREATTFRFAPEADFELKAVQEFVATERVRSEASPPFCEWLDKLPNEFGRVAQVFHQIEWAAIGAQPPVLIGRGTAARARRFLNEFMYGHALALYRQIAGAGAGDVDAIWIAGFILARDRSSIEERDIYRSYSKMKSPEKRGDIQAVMRHLEMLDWVRPAAWRSNETIKRWLVNPMVQDGRFLAIAEAERLRRSEVTKLIAATSKNRNS